MCLVCRQQYDHLFSLTCGHRCCRECWQMYFQVQILAGLSTGLSFVSVVWQQQQNNAHDSLYQYHVHVNQHLKVRMLILEKLISGFEHKNSLDLVKNSSLIGIIPPTTAKFIKVAAYDQRRSHSLHDRSLTCITAANLLQGFRDCKWNIPFTNVN